MDEEDVQVVDEDEYAQGGAFQGIPEGEAPGADSGRPHRKQMTGMAQKKAAVVGNVARVIISQLEYTDTIDWADLEGNLVEYLDTELKYRIGRCLAVEGAAMGRVKLKDHVKVEGRWVTYWVHRSHILGAYRRAGTNCRHKVVG